MSCKQTCETGGRKNMLERHPIDSSKRTEAIVRLLLSLTSTQVRHPCVCSTYQDCAHTRGRCHRHSTGRYPKAGVSMQVRWLTLALSEREGAAARAPSRCRACLPLPRPALMRVPHSQRPRQQSMYGVQWHLWTRGAAMLAPAKSNSQCRHRQRGCQFQRPCWCRTKYERRNMESSHWKCNAHTERNIRGHSENTLSRRNSIDSALRCQNSADHKTD